MTDLTSKAAEIRAGLEGVTPGPWVVTGDEVDAPNYQWLDGITIGSHSTGTRVADSALLAYNNISIARHIARLDPATVLAFLDERAEHLATIARLEGDLSIWKAGLNRAKKQFGEMEATLLDPTAVHFNMLRGTVAKPSEANILHLYPELRARLTTAESAIA